MPVRIKYILYGILIAVILIVTHRCVLEYTHLLKYNSFFTVTFDETNNAINTSAAGTSMTGAEPATAKVQTVVINSSFAIIDCIMYNSEPIVSARLEMLNETVDYFYITESTITFSGMKKETLFKDLYVDVFKPYGDKIKWNIYEPPADWGGKKDKQWDREKANQNDILNKIRDDIDKGLLPSANNAVIVSTDADEIPRPDVLEELRPGGKWYADLVDHPLHLKMILFYFNYNWTFKKKWDLGTVISAQHVIDGKNDLNKIRQQVRQPVIPDAGYHLSYALSVDDIIRKLESFSHQEYNKAKYKSREHIMKSITNEECLFFHGCDGQMIHHDYKQLPLPLQRFHLEVCKIQNVSPDDGRSMIQR